MTVASGHPDWLPPGATQWGTLLSGTANLAKTTAPQDVFVVDASSYAVAEVRLLAGTATLEGSLRAEWRDVDGTVIASEYLGTWPLSTVTTPTGAQLVVRGPRLAFVWVGDGVSGVGGTLVWTVGLRNGPWTGHRARIPRVSDTQSVPVGAGATITYRVNGLEPGPLTVLAGMEAGTGSAVSIRLGTITDWITARHRLPNLGSGVLSLPITWMGGTMVVELRNTSTSSVTVNVTVREA